jgi:hypothetical protein
MSAFHVFCYEWPYTDFIVFCKYTSHIIVVLPCCMNSTISTPFLYLEIVVISFLVDVCLNFSACLVNVCASIVLSFFGFKIQNASTIKELMEGVKTSPSSQAADFFDTGIQKLIPNMTITSILAVIMLRSSLSTYIFFLYNKFSFLIACFVYSSLEVTFRIALVH